MFWKKFSEALSLFNFCEDFCKAHNHQIKLLFVATFWCEVTTKYFKCIDLINKLETFLSCQIVFSWYFSWWINAFVSYIQKQPCRGALKKKYFRTYRKFPGKCPGKRKILHLLILKLLIHKKVLFRRSFPRVISNSWTIYPILCKIWIFLQNHNSKQSLLPPY